MIRREAIVGLILLSMVACTEPPAPEIPGLDPSEEVELVEVEPAPSDDLFVWTHAVQVGHLPQLNVGHPTAQFLEDAARVGDDPEDYLCFGDASESSGCSVEDPEDPLITGLTFGGPDVMAWSWDFIPDDAVAVRFIDLYRRLITERRNGQFGPIEKQVDLENPSPSLTVATRSRAFGFEIQAARLWSRVSVAR